MDGAFADGTGVGRNPTWDTLKIKHDDNKDGQNFKCEKPTF